MDIRSTPERDHLGIVRRWNAKNEGDPAAQEKSDHHLGTVEIFCMAVAPYEENTPFLLRINGGPDRDTMSPIKSPAGLVHYTSSGIIFLFMLAHPGTQRDRSLMRPVTAPCSHDPPGPLPCACPVEPR